MICDDGAKGDKGDPGEDGISCWDLNANGVGDIPDEDLNGDTIVDVKDCKGSKGDTGDKGDPRVVRDVEGASSTCDSSGFAGTMASRPPRHAPEEHR